MSGQQARAHCAAAAEAGFAGSAHTRAGLVSADACKTWCGQLLWSFGDGCSPSVWAHCEPAATRQFAIDSSAQSGVSGSCFAAASAESGPLSPMKALSVAA